MFTAELFTIARTWEIYIYIYVYTHTHTHIYIEWNITLS